MPFFGRPKVKELEQKRNIKELVKILKQKQAADSNEAAEALGRIGEEAIVPLIDELRKLQSKGTMEISPMTVALGKIGEPAVEPLIAAIREENTPLRLNAVVALGFIGEPAVSPLTELLQDPDGDIRGLSSANLGRIGAPAVEPLIKVLAEHWDTGRAEAAVSLGAIGDRRAIEPLRKALSDANKLVRLHSAGALAKIDKSEVQALKLLTEASQDYGPESNDELRGIATSWLKQISPA